MSHPSVRHFRLRLRDSRSREAFMPYYGSADVQLDTPSAAKLAAIIFHGAARDAIEYFCSLRTIMQKQRRVDPSEVLILAPKFYFPEDWPGKQDVWWNASKPWGDYRLAAHSDPQSAGHISSFAIIDQMVRLLSNQSMYPVLKEVLLMGHSAGGQVVQRYAATTRLRPRSKLLVKYVVANPSTYVYLNNKRWSYTCNRKSCSKPSYRVYDRNKGQRGWAQLSGVRLLGQRSGRRFVCRVEDANAWHYGLHWKRIATEAGYTVPYIAEHGHLQLAIDRYRRRDVLYLVGQNDTCTDGVLGRCLRSCWRRKRRQQCQRHLMDMSCAAMLQGKHRRERGKLYMRHLRDYYGKKVHKLVEVPNVGHEAEAIFLAETVQEHLFSK